MRVSGSSFGFYRLGIFFSLAFARMVGSKLTMILRFLQMGVGINGRIGEQAYPSALCKLKDLNVLLGLCLCPGAQGVSGRMAFI